MNWSLPIGDIATAMIWLLANVLILLSAVGMAEAVATGTAVAACAAIFILCVFRRVASIGRFAGIRVAHDLRRDDGSDITGHPSTRTRVMNLRDPPCSALESNMTASFNLNEATRYRDSRYLLATRHSSIRGRHTDVPCRWQWRSAKTRSNSQWRRAAG